MILIRTHGRSRILFLGGVNKIIFFIGGSRISKDASKFSGMGYTPGTHFLRSVYETLLKENQSIEPRIYSLNIIRAGKFVGRYLLGYFRQLSLLELKLCNYLYTLKS